ncbi:basic leucine zipper 4-like protein [Tanacetum coccineum]
MLSSVFPISVDPVPSEDLFGTGFTPWDADANPNPFVYQPQEPVFSISGSDDSTPKTNTSNSGSDEGSPVEVRNPVDDRKRRRMISNRESARRSRMRKQKHLENLRNQVTRHKTGNRELMNRLRFISQHAQVMQQENERLRSESVMLKQKLWDIQQVLLEFEDCGREREKENASVDEFPPLGTRKAKNSALGEEINGDTKNTLSHDTPVKMNYNCNCERNTRRPTEALARGPIVRVQPRPSNGWMTCVLPDLSFSDWHDLVSVIQLASLSIILNLATRLGFLLLYFTMSTIRDIKSKLNQKALDTLCTKYHIPASVHPSLPGLEKSILQSPDEMDLFAFIRHSNPTKVRVGGRDLADRELKLLKMTEGRTVALDPPANSQIVLYDVQEEAIAKDALGVVVEKPQKKRKRKVIGDASGSALPPKRDGSIIPSDATRPAVTASVTPTPDVKTVDSVSGLNLQTRPPHVRYVVSSDSSLHLDSYSEAASLVRSVADAPVVMVAVTTTIDANIAAGSKAKDVLREIEHTGDSASAGRLDPRGARWSLPLSSLKKQVEKMQDEQVGVHIDRVAIDSDLMEMALHMDAEFYPRYLTTIAGRRWLLNRRLKLVLSKCLSSPEHLSAMGEAIGRAIDKGMQD